MPPPRYPEEIPLRRTFCTEERDKGHSSYDTHRRGRSQAQRQKGELEARPPLILYSEILSFCAKRGSNSETPTIQITFLIRPPQEVGSGPAILELVLTKPPIRKQTNTFPLDSSSLGLQGLTCSRPPPPPSSTPSQARKAGWLGQLVGGCLAWPQTSTTDNSTQCIDTRLGPLTKCLPSFPTRERL